MLYHLLYPFRSEVSALNVTGYITFRTAGGELCRRWRSALSLARG